MKQKTLEEMLGRVFELLTQLMGNPDPDSAEEEFRKAKKVLTLAGARLKKELKEIKGPRLKKIKKLAKKIQDLSSLVLLVREGVK